MKVSSEPIYRQVCVAGKVSKLCDDILSRLRELLIIGQYAGGREVVGCSAGTQNEPVTGNMRVVVVS